MRRLCWLAVPLVLLMPLAASAGPRADALLRMGVVLTIPDSLQDATLLTDNGCVELDGALSALLVCRVIGTNIQSDGELLVVAASFRKIVHDKLASNPSAPIPTAPVATLDARGVYGAVADAFLTTKTSIRGVPRSETYGTTAFGDDTLLNTFVATAPTGDAITILFATSAQYMGAANDEMRAIEDGLYIAP